MVCPKLWGTNNVGIGTLGDPCEVSSVGTLGAPWGVTVTGTLGDATSVWKMSVSSCMILLVVSPFRNGVCRCGCLIADDSSSIAAVIRSSEDVLGMLYLVGRNSIVSDTRWPPSCRSVGSDLMLVW